MDAHAARLSLSAATVAEIEDGSARLRREGARRRGRQLAARLETLRHRHASRILPFDLSVARVAGASRAMPQEPQRPESPHEFL